MRKENSSAAPVEALRRKGENGMTDRDLISALRGAMVETGSILCLGCGREHNCSIHGCAILRAAAERLEALAPQANEAPNGGGVV